MHPTIAATLSACDAVLYAPMFADRLMHQVHLNPIGRLIENDQRRLGSIALCSKVRYID